MAKKSKPEVWTGERCFITELVNDAAWPEFSLARTRVEPGVTTQLHALPVHEVYVIESGTGRMSVGDAAPFPAGLHKNLLSRYSLARRKNLLIHLGAVRVFPVLKLNDCPGVKSQFNPARGSTDKSLFIEKY